MATLTTTQVEHIAKLARLNLRPEQLEKMTQELGSILGYIEILNEVNTDTVEPTAQVTGLSTVLRQDDVIASDASADALLACSPLPLEDHQIVTPSAH